MLCVIINCTPYLYLSQASVVDQNETRQDKTRQDKTRHMSITLFSNPISALRISQTVLYEMRAEAEEVVEH